MVPKYITWFLFGLSTVGAGWISLLGLAVLLYTALTPNSLPGLAAWCYVVLVVPFFLLAVSERRWMSWPIWILSIMAFTLSILKLPLFDEEKVKGVEFLLLIVGIPAVAQIARICRSQSAKGATTS